MSGITFNEDCSHFFGSSEADEPDIDDLNAWLDQYAGTQVREMVLNLNAQRSNVPSEVKQTAWDGYDPQADNSQPFFGGAQDNYRGMGKGQTAGYRRYIHSVWSLSHRGIDPYAHWVGRCREKGIDPWISIRMNDVHYTDLHDHPIHDRIWREHPEWQVAPWRNDNLIDSCLDYAQPEVYEYNLAYVREIIARYDPDGIELDWLRSCYNFRSGYEIQGSPILTEFHVRVREALDAREKEVGHPIKLGVRVPGHPETTRCMGMDVVTWARRDLIDQLCITDHLFIDSDMPVELWRQLLEGTGVILAPTVFNAQRPGEGLGVHFQSLETARGIAASLLDRGADRIYLFNCMDDPGWGDDQKASYRQFLREIGSLETMATKSRRHLVTYCDQGATGEAMPRALPRACACDYGEEFRLNVGPAPQSGQRAQVRLAARIDDQPVAPNAAVRVNGAPCPHRGEVALPRGFQKPMPLWDVPEDRIHPYRMQAYDVPENVLHRGDNVIEIRNQDEEEITIIWVEIAISDTDGHISQNPIESGTLP